MIQDQPVQDTGSTVVPDCMELAEPVMGHHADHVLRHGTLTVV